MRKIIFVILALVMLLNFSVLALDTALFDLRNRIFEESKEIKSLLQDSKDAVLVSSMWDSCIIAMTQIDAYFSMLGIFNTIKKENLSDASINYLIDWLGQIKGTNELNIKNLSALYQPMEPNTEVHVAVLTDYFGNLNKQIDVELDKLSIIKKTLTK